MPIGRSLLTLRPSDNIIVGANSATKLALGCRRATLNFRHTVPEQLDQTAFLMNALGAFVRGEPTVLCRVGLARTTPSRRRGIWRALFNLLQLRSGADNFLMHALVAALNCLTRLGVSICCREPQRALGAKRRRSLGSLRRTAAVRGTPVRPSPRLRLNPKKEVPNAWQHHESAGTAPARRTFGPRSGR
jgi:hypothetical protein